MAVKPTKLETISKQLHRPAGVNIVQLQKVTGWQSHSIRAALTGLRKKGLAIERSKSAKGDTVYRRRPISSAAPAWDGPVLQLQTAIGKHDERIGSRRP